MTRGSGVVDAEGFPGERPYEDLSCTRDGPVATVKFARPQALNAITPRMEAELHRALDLADADQSIRAVVLAGDDRSFCSGYDFADAPEFETQSARVRHWWDVHMGSPDRHWHLMEMGTPVIAAVRGWCLGGGFWYAVCADITVAGEGAVFGQPEVREAENSTVLLSILAGWKNAHRYALTGDHFDAQEGLRLGIVNELVPDDEVLPRSTALAQRIARITPASVRMNKAITVAGLEAMGVRAAMRSAALVAVVVHAAGDDPDLDELRRVRNEQGMRASLRWRDDPFRPEPGGPRSRDRDDTRGSDAG